jgi:hypothetical protein
MPVGHSQTIKCLLIVPNPESALNEEAGKMLLEHYDDYCTRARMFTEIHARPSVKYVHMLTNVYLFISAAWQQLLQVSFQSVYQQH